MTGEEYDYFLKEVNEIIGREKGDAFLKKYINAMEQKQKEGFMEGYKYAIRVLEDGLVKKQENRQD